MEVKTDLSPTDSAPISERHSTFWFDDGSIIICVEDTAFKVHRSHLARHSEIFADLFNVPQPPDTPNIEGCPIVHLPDRKSDFVDLLKALYNPLYFDSLDPDAGLASRVIFIEGILRLSTKYFITEFRRKCVSIMTRCIPLTLDDFDGIRNRLLTSKNPSSPLLEAMIRAIIVAQEMSVADGLPFLYYYVAINISPKRLLVNGAADLSWRDKTICMVARERLRVAWKETYAFLHNFTPTRECQRRQECQAAQGLHSQWSLVKNIVQDDPLLPFDKWKALGLCHLCRDNAIVRYTVARSRLWDSLPTLFNLQTHKS